MSTKEVLELIYDQWMDKLFAYSGNYLMTKPRPGLENEWRQAKEVTTVIRHLIDNMDPGTSH